MVRAICSDKKGIYKDLYRTIETDNQKEKNIQKQRKGIYANLYRQFEEDKQNISFKRIKKKNEKLSLLVIFNKVINQVYPKVSYIFSHAAGNIKILILTFMVVKKPIINYIENKLPVYQIQKNQGFYYNDR